MEATCHVEPIEKTASVEDLRAAKTAILAIWGMGCPNCANRVRNSLLAREGVVSAEIDLERGFAFVGYLERQTNLRALVLAVSAAGNDGQHHYRAEIIS